ncbi:MAG: dimethyl sulfoxide reductase anchor subunit family protein [Bilophila wadsworthia]
MHGYWSLVIFTLLGQAAAGMLILSFFSRTADTSRAKAWAACILLGVGALASLEHLSDPTVSFYTITNVGTSWLSREILFVGLFGAGLLLWLITLNAWARRLAAILGLAFVYVMSRVYTIPTVPFWNSCSTGSFSPPACCSVPACCSSWTPLPPGRIPKRRQRSCSAGIPYSSYWPSYSKCW